LAVAFIELEAQMGAWAGGSGQTADICLSDGKKIEVTLELFAAVSGLADDSLPDHRRLHVVGRGITRDARERTAALDAVDAGEGGGDEAVVRGAGNGVAALGRSDVDLGADEIAADADVAD